MTSLPIAPNVAAPEIAKESYRAPTQIADVVNGSPYVGYAYSYPHKTAYRPLTPPRPLAPLWEAEDKDALFLYAHVPFCEMRCGFCNLFTQVRPRDFESLQDRYLDTLARQASRVRNAVGQTQVARFAIGGGTPTQLTVSQLARLFEIAETFGVSAKTYTGIETSPDTATREHLAQLRAFGVNRVSIGVQSFDPKELAAAGRPSKVESARAALTRINESGIETLNLDLIYGIAGQTTKSFLWSIEQALTYAPRELFLYPLYVRTQTGLGRRDQRWRDARLEQYRVGRARLLDAGYEQISMRFFRHRDAPVPVADYSCQSDGMIGLGCGARSYTRALHYSEEWAVGKDGVRGIIEQWIARDDHDFDHAWHGADVPIDEQRRRFVIQSLLHRDGLDREAYRARFGDACEAHVPELRALLETELVRDGEVIFLTAEGMERSDTVGPWLYSPETRTRSAAYEVR